MAIPTEKRGGTGKKGMAEVRVKEDMDMLVIKFDDSDDLIKVEYDPTKVGYVSNGRYRVSMSASGDKIFGMTPEKGTYIVRYDGMVAKEGQVPSPFVVKGGERKRKDGGTFKAEDYLAFTVLLRIVSKENKGVHLPVQLTYSFEQYKDTGETLILLGRVAYERTAQFLEYAGIDFNTDTIPYSENILPWIDETLQKRNVKFQVSLKDGYVDDMFQLAKELDD